MCYMSASEKRVGVRELRQNLSVYLRRVIQGQTYEITDRGKPVALITPAPEVATALRRLVASGRASAPAGDLLALGPPPKSRRAGAIHRALADQREERF